MFEIGASLREARVKRGLSAADVQKAIRIRDRYLHALEEEGWELLPGDAYVKGFLRTYADFLGLDGNLYVDEYNSRYAHHEETGLAPQPFGRMDSGRRRTGLLRPALAIGAIVAAVAAVAAWQLDRSSGNPPRAGSSTGTTTGSTTTETRTATTTRPPPVALPSRAVLVASRGNCWLEIRQGSPSGTLIYQSTLQQGQKLPVKLTSGPVWIRIGAPSSLDIRLGGKLLQGLPKHTGNILLSRTGLKSA